MKKLLILFILCMLELTSILQKGLYATSSTQSNNEDRKSIDTTGITFLLEGKKITSQYAIEKLQKGEIKMYGADKPKDAVSRFGEKYRNGIFICEIIKEEDEQD